MAVMRTRATILLAAGALAVLASCASGATRPRSTTRGWLLLPRSVATSTTPAPTTTTLPVPDTTLRPAVTTPPTVAPTTEPPLPVPSPPPLERGLPGAQVGSIDIPKIGLSLPLFDGVNLATLDEGPGHWPGTARPGELGNAVIAAHRVSHGGPFRKIDKLVAGDEVRFNVDGKQTVYTVVANEVVPPEGIHIIEQTPDYTATLFACHPPGSTKFRYVVHLKLAGT